MINLNESHIFTRVVQTGSFTSAADALGMTVSTVSRKVADLEARLGVTLLLRTTRKINLTQVGSQYYQQCSIHLQAINDAEEEVSRLQTEAEGTLRIAVPVSLTSGTFINFLSDFAKKNILIKIEVISSNQYSDLVSDGIDVAIRIGHLSDSGLIARKLGMTSRNIVASPKYLKIKGTPKQPQDLEQHNCLIFRSKTNQSIWEFNKGRSNKRIKVNGQFVSNELQKRSDLLWS
jgi:DNA-binding transcriptional LysR family regulator